MKTRGSVGDKNKTSWLYTRHNFMHEPSVHCANATVNLQKNNFFKDFF